MFLSKNAYAYHMLCQVFYGLWEFVFPYGQTNYVRIIEFMNINRVEKLAVWYEECNYPLIGYKQPGAA